MGTQAVISTLSPRSVAPAQRVLALGALGMLVISTGLGGAGAAFGGPRGPALRLHADASSLGWLTLGVLAVAVGMSARNGSAASVRRAGSLLALTAVAAVVAFVVADVDGSAAAAAWSGIAVLVAIVAVMGWLPTVSPRTRDAWTAPRQSLAVALGVLISGYVLGTVAAWLTVSGNSNAAASLAAARSAVLAVPVVVLVATATVEWASVRAAAATPLTTAGLVQVGALALAAVALIVGVLTSDLALTEANIPLELTGIAIFLVRVGPGLLRAGWWRGSRIWLVTSAVALAADVGLFAHVVFEVGVQRYASAGLVPAWLVFSVDHVTFAGVGTAALLGGFAAMTGVPDRWPAAETVAAVGLVLGLAGTALGVGVGSTATEAVAGTVFGLSVLLAAVLAGLRVMRTHEPADSTGGGKMMPVP
jgi:hypothetical protein